MDGESVSLMPSLALNSDQSMAGMTGVSSYDAESIKNPLSDMAKGFALVATGGLEPPTPAL